MKIGDRIQVHPKRLTKYKRQGAFGRVIAFFDDGTGSDWLILFEKGCHNNANYSFILEHTNVLSTYKDRDVKRMLWISSRDAKVVPEKVTIHRPRKPKKRFLLSELA